MRRSLKLLDFQIEIHFSKQLKIPCWFWFILSWQLKHQNIVWNLFKVNTKDIRTMSMTLFWCSGIFKQILNRFNFEQISRIVFVFPLKTLNSQMPAGNNL